MTDVSDLCTDALTRLGVVGGGETPATEDMTLAFNTLNRLNDAWGLEGLLIPYIARTTATITANQTSYSVGSGGDINIVRPVYVTDIRFIDTSQDPDLEMPLTILTDDDYARIPQKAQTNTYPSAAYYNPTYASARGTLIPWPIPTSTTLQWAFYSKITVPVWAATTTTVSVPTGYERFIVTNLAAELIPMFVSVPENVAQRVDAQARESKAAVKVANYRPSDLISDAAGIGHGGGYWGRSRFLSGP